MAKECFDELRKLLPDEVSDSSIRKHIADVKEIRDQLGDLPKVGDYQKKLSRMIEDRKNLLQSQRVELANNIRKKRANISHIFQEDFKGNPLEGIRSLIDSGTGFLSKGGNRGVSRIRSVFHDKWRVRLSNGLDDIGAVETFRSGKLDKEIMMELFELKEGGKSGISKNAEALNIAKVIRGIQTDIVHSLRSAGSTIGEIPGYIMRQSHNGELVGKIRFKEWSNKIVPLLDMEKTFGNKSKNQEAIVKILRDTYNDIVTGKRDTSQGISVSDELITINKTSKLDSRISKSRALHFKDGESFFKYNSEFGKNSLAESLLSSINKNSRDVGLIEVFGTNPDAALEALIKKVENSLIDSPKELAKFQGGLDQLRNVMDLQKGITTIPGRNLGAKAGVAIRSVNNMSLLGRAVIRSVSDLGTAAVSLKSATGKGFLESYRDTIVNFLKSVKPSDRKRAAELFSISVNDTLGEIHSRMDATADIGPGGIAKVQSMVMKLTGLPWQSTTARVSVARSFSQELGTNAGKNFNDIHPRLKASMERAGIDSLDWNVLRKTSDDIGYNQTGINPDGFAKNVTDGQIEGLLKAKKIKINKASIERAKFDLENKIASYLTDNAEVGSPTPGARTRNFILRGTKAGSLDGEALRFAGQFKSFIIQMHHVNQRVGLSNPNARAKTLLFGKQNVFRAGGKEDVQNLAALIASLTVLGYAGQVATDIAQNRTPQNPLDPKVMLDSFSKGGAGGIYGDFLLGEYDKSNRSFIVDLAGPTARKADQVLSLLSKARKGKELKASDWRIIEQSIPGQNLFYLRGALDYLILKNMQEAINPGALRRAEKRLRSRGQRTIAEPLGT